MESLPDVLVKGLKKCFSIKELYSLQKEALKFLTTPAPMDGIPLCALMGLSGDCVINAPTGYGKTLAYVLPIMKYLLDIPKEDWKGHSVGVRALVLVPSNELVMQVTDTLAALCEHVNKKRGFGPRVVGLQSGISWIAEVRNLFEGGHVGQLLVATPARFLEHCNNADLTRYLTHLRYMVLDEADLLIERHLDDLALIIDLLDSVKHGGGKTIRKVLCSATLNEGSVVLSHVSLQCPKYFSLDDDLLQGEGQKTISLPAKLDCFLWRYRGMKSDMIQEFEPDLIDLQTNEIRDRYVWHILRDFYPKWHEEGRLRKTRLQRLNRVPKTIIFVNSRDNAINLSKRLNAQYEHFKTVMSTGASSRTLKPYEGGITRAIHPILSIRDRKKVLASFLENEFPVLVSTEVTGRGIDDLSVEMVISFDAPTSISSFVHRSGRTARAGDFGSAVHLCGQRDMTRLMGALRHKAEHLINQIMDYEDILLPERERKAEVNEVEEVEEEQEENTNEADAWEEEDDDDY